jgi:protein gp37
MGELLKVDFSQNSQRNRNLYAAGLVVHDNKEYVDNVLQFPTSVQRFPSMKECLDSQQYINIQNRIHEVVSNRSEKRVQRKIQEHIAYLNKVCDVQLSAVFHRLDGSQCEKYPYHYGAVLQLIELRAMSEKRSAK